MPMKPGFSIRPLEPPAPYFTPYRRNSQSASYEKYIISEYENEFNQLINKLHESGLLPKLPFKSKSQSNKLSVGAMRNGMQVGQNKPLFIPSVKLDSSQVQSRVNPRERMMMVLTDMIRWRKGTVGR